MTSLKDKFFNKVNRLPNGCWIWTGTKNGKYAGSITVNLESYPPGKFIHSIMSGEYIWGYASYRSCGDTLCVNPFHIVWRNLSE